jgi:DNA-binding SARP family transcriptional activator
VIKISKSRERLRIELFGEFAIIGNGKRITENTKKSSKVWRLLQYLITHRNRSIPQEELLEVFCGDQVDGGNPGSVLRTMVYRARSALEKGGIENAASIIVAKSGGYSINKNIECTTDVEEFEELIKKAETPDIKSDVKLNLLLHATALYKGDFLPNSNSDMWVVPLVRWYRTMYLDAVHDALELLNMFQRSREAAELCTKALGVDPFDVKLIEFHIKALLKQGKNSEALNFYKRMESMFFDVLGVNFSNELRDLYNEIQQPEAKDEAELDDVLAEWVQDADYPGAYYCDASVFKIFFQIEARGAQRSGRSSFVVRFDTKHIPKGQKPSGVIRQLGMAIPRCLRMGDLFTRFSHNQYMLMLFSLTYEDCKMLVNRIMRSMDSKYISDIKSSQICLISAIKKEEE